MDILALLNQQKLAKISSGNAVLDLSMINPDIEPPRLLTDKLVEASLRPDCHRYGVSRGVRKLRDAFVSKYIEAFGVKLDPEYQVCVTMGSKEALVHTLMCLPSDCRKALIGSPTYPAHLSAMELAGFRCDFFEIGWNEDRMLDAITNKLASERYGVLLLNFPNNPTGVVVSRGFYEKLRRAAEARDVFVINDFVYGEMEYQKGTAESLLTTGAGPSQAAEIYSLSKAYSVPGWRVGALLGDERVVKALGHLKAQTDYGIFLPIQEAAAAALCASSDATRPIVDCYRRRSSLLIAGLKNLGWNVSVPRAGASVWVELPGEICGGDAELFAVELLENEGIMLLPGSLFGQAYRAFVRFALVVSEEKLHDAVVSINRFCRSKRGVFKNACAAS